VLIVYIWIGVGVLFYLISLGMEDGLKKDLDNLWTNPSLMDFLGLLLFLPLTIGLWPFCVGHIILINIKCLWKGDQNG